MNSAIRSLEDSPDFIGLLKEKGRLYRLNQRFDCRQPRTDEIGHEFQTSVHDDATGEVLPGELTSVCPDTIFIKNGDTVSTMSRAEFDSIYELSSHISQDYSSFQQKPKLLVEVDAGVLQALGANDGDTCISANLNSTELGSHTTHVISKGDYVGKGIHIPNDAWVNMNGYSQIDEHTNVFEKVRAQMDKTLQNTGTMHVPMLSSQLTPEGYCIPDGSRVGDILRQYNGDANMSLELFQSKELAAQQWFLDIQKALNTEAKLSQSFSLDEGNQGFDIICEQLDTMKAAFAGRGWDVSWSGVPGAPGAYSLIEVTISVHYT